MRTTTSRASVAGEPALKACNPASTCASLEKSLRKAGARALLWGEAEVGSTASTRTRPPMRASSWSTAFSGENSSLRSASKGNRTTTPARSASAAHKSSSA
jgi:hypothetical protein